MENGDSIRFDLLNGTVEVLISDDVMEQRRSALPEWKPRPPIRGYLRDFAATVSQANHGCVSTSILNQ